MSDFEKKWYTLCIDFIEEIDKINTNISDEDKTRILDWYEGMIKMRTMATNISNTQENK
jgi:hypothetical protein